MPEQPTTRQRRFFERELESFRSNLLIMGEKAVEIVTLALQALREQDPLIAQRILAADDEIDDMEITIDGEAVRYLSLRAPVAHDLRLLTVGMKVGHELERVGDESVSIARRVQHLSGMMPVKEFHHLPQMGEFALSMLRESIEAFVNGDEEKARAIAVKDKLVDNLNAENVEILTETITTRPDQVATSLELIFVSKSLERVADHATNIAEEAIYLKIGQDVRHDPTLKAQKHGLD